MLIIEICFYVSKLKTLTKLLSISDKAITKEIKKKTSVILKQFYKGGKRMIISKPRHVAFHGMKFCNPVDRKVSKT